MNVADLLRRVTAYGLLTGYLILLYLAVWAGIHFSVGRYMP